MTTTDATYRKEIVFDRETRDFAMYLDGELVGYARTYHEAEITLDELVYELLSSGATATASALDGDSDVDECAGEGDCPDCDSLIGCEVITCTQPATHFSASGAMSALCCACFVTAFGEPCGCASVAIDATTAETTDMQSLLAFARDRGACSEARLWLNTQTDPRVAWEMCERPDWMIWFARRRNVARKVLVRIACDCARTVLRFVPEGEERPRLAIEAAERWTRDEATIDEVRAAAADAATYAAGNAADAAGNAAAYAAYAADAAAYAATGAIQMCQIIRTHLRYEDVAL